MAAEIKIALIVILLFMAFAGYCLYHNVKQKKDRMEKIKRSWGKRPEREYSLAEFDAISHYFEQKKKEGFFIDDITWKDLDMDTIFMLLNHTWSCIGESYLYSMLRTPSFSKEELEERERLVEYFENHGNEREQMECFFAGIGKTGARSIFDYIYNLADYHQGSKVTDYVAILLFLCSIGLIIVSPPIGVMVLLGTLFFSWSTYFTKRKQIEPYVMSCSCLLEMLRAADDLKKLEMPETEGYIGKIAQARKKFNRFKRNAFFVIAGASMNAGGGIEQSIAAYINFTLHVDLIQFGTLVHELKNNLDAFEMLTENMGMLESAIAIASFRKMMPSWCKPALSKSDQVFLKTENLYHPMIDNPVKNSIAVERGVLLTGSNASGKSTFLKTVAINALLGQTIYTCLADSYEQNFCQIYSSMALQDDLLSQESYYIVEIKSLKRILDHVKDEVPLLCFVDEVLRGTNTIERIAASSQILKSLEQKNVMCFAATHDIELTHILEEGYCNFHFQEEVFENDILFNYQLYEGRATSRNAIKLLSIIGYEDEIIERAKEAAERFEETGEWSL